MAAGAWKVFTTAKEYIGDSTIDLDTHSFKICILNSSKAPALTDSVFATFTSSTHWAANVGAATTNPYSLGTLTWAATGTSIKLDDPTSPTWTAATSGAMVAKYAVIYDDTVTSPADPLLCYCDLNTSGSGISVSASNTLTINFAASGILQLGGAT